MLAQVAEATPQKVLMRDIQCTLPSFVRFARVMQTLAKFPKLGGVRWTSLMGTSCGVAFATIALIGAQMEHVCIESKHVCFFTYVNTYSHAQLGTHLLAAMSHVKHSITQQMQLRGLLVECRLGQEGSRSSGGGRPGKATKEGPQKGASGEQSCRGKATCHVGLAPG